MTATTATSTKHHHQQQQTSQSHPQPLWQFQELQTTVGKDYQLESEVTVYDETHSTFRDLLGECRHVLDGLFHVTAGQILLDFGCGTGTMVVEAAKRGLQVHGIDVSPTMLTLANQKAIQEKIRVVVDDDLDGDDETTPTTTSSSSSGRIQFHHAGFLTYEHEKDGEDGFGGVVDYITTTYALHHLPDLWKQVALQRMSKLLKKVGGKLHLRDVVVSTPPTTTNSSESSFNYMTIPTQIEQFVQSQTQLGLAHNDNGFLQEDAEQHFREEYSTYDWILEGMMERAGLDIIKKEVECNGIIITYLCEKK